MAVDFSYEEVARLLSMLDTANGESLEATLGGLHVSVTSWPKMREEEEGAPAEPVAGGARRDASRGKSAGTDAVHDLTHVLAKAPTVGVFHFEGGSRTSVKLGCKVRESERIGEVAEFGGQARPVLSPLDGELVDLCVAEGDFVAYGQTVAVVKHPEVQNDTYAGG